MSGKADKLEKLRRRIDSIDDQILDLIIKRTDVVEEIGDAKRATLGGELGGSLGMRPDREASLMRRILDRHDGRLPEIVIAGVWRELISAFTRLQGPLKVAVCAPEKSVGYWDLARKHFGSATPMTLHRTHGDVLRAISAGDGAVGILPLPQEGEEEPWWPHLAGKTENAPRVIARLPFVEDPTAWFEGLGALALAPVEHVDSGDDISLVVIAVDPQISRARLLEQLTACKLSGRIISAVDKGGDMVEWQHLVEIDGHVKNQDTRIADFIKKSDGAVERVMRIGGYARPIKAGAPPD